MTRPSEVRGAREAVADALLLALGVIVAVVVLGVPAALLLAGLAGWLVAMGGGV